MYSENLFLKTKFICQKFDEDLFVLRKDLEEKFSEISNSKILYISAPSGFGKTTLISQWLKNNINSIFVYLDDGDNIYNRFLSCVIESFNTIFPEKINYFINSSIEPYEVEHILINIIKKSKDKEIFFILDNFHVITNQKIYDLLIFFIKISSKNIHFVISSKFEIPINFSDLIIQNKSVFINLDDFLIMNDEIKVLLELNKIELDDEYIDLINKKTEGWILAIKTILISLNNYKNKKDFFIQSSSFTNKYLKDFLTNNILKNIDLDVFEFLKKTSVLKSFNFSVCNKLLGINNSQFFIDKIVSLNLFIISLDSNKDWFRYHSIFSETLLDIQKREDESLVNKLYLKASNILFDMEYFNESLDYLFMTNDFLIIADELEKQAPIFFRDYNHFHLHELIEKIPREIVLSKIKLSLYYGLILALIHENKLSEIMLNNAEKLYHKSNNEDKETQAIINILKSLLYVENKDNNNKITKYSNLALNNINNINPNSIGFCLYCLSRTFFYLLNINKVFKIIDRSILYTKNSFMSIVNEVYKASILINIGRFIEAEKILIELFEQIKNRSLLYSKISLNVVSFLCTVYYNFNDRVLFEHYSKIGLEIIEISPRIYVRNHILFYYGLITPNFIFGNIEQSKNYRDISIKLNYYSEINDLDYIISLIDIKIHLYNKNLDKIDPEVIMTITRLINQSYYDNNKNYSKISGLIRNSLILSKYYLAKGMIKEADSMIDILISFNTEFSRQSTEIEILLLISILHKKKNNKQKSINFMKKALFEAEKNNYIQVFIEEKNETYSIIKNVVEELEEKNLNVDKSFAYIVLKNINLDITSKIKRLSVKKILNPLSKKENEVIVLISKELSNKNISLNLNITENTLKVHLKNIFRKLGVKNRKEALLKAKSLKIN